MPEPLPPVLLRSVARHSARADRGVAVAVAGVAALLVLALVKPWPGAATVAPGGGSAGAAPATPTPQPTPSADPTAVGDAVPCLATDGWRLVTLEIGPIGNMRSWSVIEPGATTAQVIRTPGLFALGFCAPAGATGSGLDIRAVTVEAGPADAAGPALAVTPLARPAGLDGAVWAHLYGVPIGLPPLLVEGVPTWPSGTYRFDVRGPGATPATISLVVAADP
ncbi:MAG TPA: hypothetical protein VMH24_03705 [Candidatus Sulfotelmatobacter sp.]|nr:hypothetical protein [Candidatus Sulfotelmatobacter sp.]